MLSLSESAKRSIRAMLDERTNLAPLVYVPEPAEPLIASFHAPDASMPPTGPAFEKRILLVREMAAPMPWTGEWEMAYRWRVAVEEAAPMVPVVQGTPEPVRTGRRWWDPAVHTFVP